MKRNDVTAIVLGALAFVFFLPFAILFTGLIALFLGRTNGGIGTGAFGFSLRRMALLLALIVCLPILVSWISRRISRARG